VSPSVKTPVVTGLLDTSVVIDLHSITDPQSLPQEPRISAITLAELSVGPLVANSQAERIKRQAVLQQVEASFDPLPFDPESARAFGSVAAQLRSGGSKSKARAFDALIAATALANGLPLYTRNAADFAGIAGLEVVEVSEDS